MKTVDFSFDQYDRLMQCLKLSALRTYTVREYLNKRPGSDFAILRHDVEYKAKKSYDIALMESKQGIRSTYYFHGPHKRVYDIKIMKAIQDMGHEIGYHYETLDRCNGNFRKAIALFEAQLIKMRSDGFIIDTVCSHGNPRKRKIGYGDNSEIFSSDPDLLVRNGLIGEAYRSIDFNALTYLSDVGVRWNRAENTTEIIQKIYNGKEKRIYMLAHMDYWSKSAVEAIAWKTAAKIIRATKVNKIVAAGRYMMQHGLLKK
jgi:hypothetical protein